jgi:two-component system CheB/CheR fusion protein
MRKIDTKKPASEKPAQEKPFPITAIGASAGGIEAVTDLLKHLPADTGMAYIYIQHLDPEHESKLSEILSKVSKLPVQEATDKLKILPDHVYIIPPNREMTLVDGVLLLNLRPINRKSFMPINQFFTSLAETYKERSIGIILSGTLTDGTLGLKAIKAAGGITFAQDKTARFQGMPQNAVAEDVVDLILSPKKIAEELSKLSSQQEIYHTTIQALSEDIFNERDEDLQNILKQVHSLSGVDFTQYKINTIRRRIVRRMILHKIDNLKEYAGFVKHHANEATQLYQDFLINVTNFFRDNETAEYLKKQLLPKIIKSKSLSETIRIWIPACSTGQEAYSSLAMLLLELLGDAAPNTPIQIFATDLSELAINKARLGIYSKDEVGRNISQTVATFLYQDRWQLPDH